MTKKGLQRSRSISPNPTPREDPKDAKKKDEKEDKNERKTSDELRRVKSTGALPRTSNTQVERISKSSGTSPGNAQVVPYVNDARSTNLRTGFRFPSFRRASQRPPSPEKWATILKPPSASFVPRPSEPLIIEEYDGPSTSAQSSSTNVRPEIVIHSEPDREDRDRDVEAGPGPSNTSRRVAVESSTRQLPPLRIQRENETVARRSVPINVLPITSHTEVAQQTSPTSRSVPRNVPNRYMPRDVLPGAVPLPDLPSPTPPLSPSRTIPERAETPLPIIVVPAQPSTPPATPRGFFRRFLNALHAGYMAFRRWYFS
ncbi:unnamed protein product [Caenorhabditis angaria]|uniref:Uncharacterized protein n=1 Tax=Caenorhabditis angaria TaxID=860376 RepID=A0A9P1IHB7_9PELO|nr:unnamed protein product [Caenorhabditis angaria]